MPLCAAVTRDFARMPTWVPDFARLYLAHTEAGEPIRRLARQAGCHPSTVLRRIRRCETRRDDFLVDAALHRLGRGLARRGHPGSGSGRHDMIGGDIGSGRDDGMQPMSDGHFETEARRILHRLCEPGAVLAVAEGMEKAVVARETGAESPARTAVVAREVAEAMALKGWIGCDDPARVARYRITRAGRAELNRLLAAGENHASGLAEAPAPFLAIPGSGAAPAEEPSVGARRRARYGVVESPLLALARRRDRDGEPFLPDPLVRAGERLREDFVLAECEPSGAQGWEGYVSGATPVPQTHEPPGGAAAARARAAAALRDLGPGLGDVVLRCCCRLEGLEQAERQMGWSARSAKIVLRIALQRLRRHYASLGDGGGLIGG